MISPFYQNLKRTYNIHIFRSNINTESDLETLHRYFVDYPGIHKWSVDLEDIDKVLRIESSKNVTASTIIEGVIGLGYFCEELE